MEASINTTLSPALIHQGTALVEEILTSWSDKTSLLAPADSEDVTMEEGDLNAMVAQEYSLLKECFEENRTRLEETEWTRTVLSTTY